MATRKLKAVPDGAVPKREKPENIKAAVECTERDLLVALRTKVASEIDNGVPAHALASTVKQLRELDKAIRTLDAQSAHDAPSPGDVDDRFDAEAL